MNYVIYDNGELLAGFVSLCMAVVFASEWHNGSRRIDIVNAKTGEVIDTWTNGAWENGSFQVPKI